jgi:hypothetical protein
MNNQTKDSIITAFCIAKAYVDAQYAKNHLQAVIDPEFAKANMDKQLRIIDLSEELDQGAKEFEKEYCNDNNY